VAATHPRPQTAHRAPLTAHPLVPLIVVLWFGTLFFLSTLVMDGDVIARLVVASHLDLIVPGATPPLHGTARLLVAALAGLVGAGLGALVARLMAPRDAAAPTRAAERAEARAAAAAPEEAPAHTRRRPLYAYEDLDAEGRFTPVGAPPPAAVSNGPTITPAVSDAPVIAPAPSVADPALHPVLTAPASYHPAPWSVGMSPRPPRLPEAPPAAAMIVEHDWAPAPETPAIAAPEPLVPAEPAPEPAPEPSGAQGGAELLDRLAQALERRRQRIETDRPAPSPRAAASGAANDTSDPRQPGDTTAALDRALRALRDLD